MTRANYHTHTFRCGHAVGTPLDYAKEAVAKNLCELGMSDHCPFPQNNHGSRMKYEELDQYLDEIDIAKSIYKDKLNILKSVEIEFTKTAAKDNYYDFLLSSKKMDYLILGQHWFYDKYGDFHTVYNLRSAELALDYAAACVQGMKTGCFKILAHPDIFAYELTIGWNDFYEQACDMIIQAAIDTKTILEFNANGIRRGKQTYPDEERYLYPHKRFWQKAKQAGLCAIVGSDAHSPDVLWDDAVEKSISIMNENGIRRIEKL